MARTQKNKATSYHLGLLKAKLAKLRRELLTPSSGGGGGGGGNWSFNQSIAQPYIHITKYNPSTWLVGFDVAKTGVARIGFVGSYTKTDDVLFFLILLMLL